MLELLSHAWIGWQSFMKEGKYGALCILVLLFFWFCVREQKERKLLVYTTLMVVCCICPVTAAVLMKFQTGFYDYRWIWSYVPLTIVIALGGVIFLWKQWECYEGEENISQKQKMLKKIGISLLILALINLCGSLGNIEFESDGQKQLRENTRSLLARLTEDAESSEICLWAPKAIMANARAVEADITLVYGRNIWDTALGAYFYEPYGQAEEMLYGWMSSAEVFGELKAVGADGLALDGLACMELARNLGVNVILLPGNMQESAVKAIEEYLGITADEIEDYYCIRIDI